jgi:hypothetical protein
VRPLLVVAALLAGCAPTPSDTELLELSGTERDWLEGAQPLVIQGQDFPVGRRAQVRLQGTFHRPGRAPRSLALLGEGEVRTLETLEVRFPSGALDRLGEGTVDGRLHVRIRAARGWGAVTGRTPELRLDLRPERGPSLVQALEAERRGDALLEGWGIVVDDEEARGGGLRVAEVRSGSAAERAGLVEGDRLIEARGVRVHATRHLLPAPEATRMPLRFAREHEAAPIAVVLEVDPSTAEGDDRTRWAIGLGAGWLLLVLLTLAPTARVLDVLRPAPGATPASAPWLALAFLASLAVAFAGDVLRPSVPSLVLAAVALRVACRFVDDRPVGARLLCAARTSIASAPHLVATVAAASLAGSGAIDALAAAQGAPSGILSALPFAIAVPFGPLLPIVGVVGLVLPRRARGAAGYVDDLALIVLSHGLAVSCLGLGARGLLPVLLRATVGFLLFLVVRRLQRPRPFRAVLGGLLAAAVLGGMTLGWLLHPLPEVAEALVPAWTFAAALFVLGVSVRAWKAPEEPTVARPFL